MGVITWRRVLRCSSGILRSLRLRLGVIVIGERGPCRASMAAAPASCDPRNEPWAALELTRIQALGASGENQAVNLANDRIARDRTKLGGQCGWRRARPPKASSKASTLSSVPAHLIYLPRHQGFG